jgi:regulator of nonsense transcripts 2
MEIEFVIQDTFARSRPNWKLAKNLEEAAAVFQSAMAQQQKLTGVDRGPEVDERSTPSSSEDEIADNDLEGDMDGDGDSNSEEEEAEVCPASTVSFLADTDCLAPCKGLDSQHSGRGSDSEEEAIVVTREEEEIDEEDAAEFEREYAKMMAESLESRKHERKPLFDVPLPMRSKNREASETKGSGGEGSSTMAFSLLTKKGNRQQVTSLTGRQMRSESRIISTNWREDQDSRTSVRLHICHGYEE